MSFSCRRDAFRRFQSQRRHSQQAIKIARLGYSKLGQCGAVRVLKRLTVTNLSSKPVSFSCQLLTRTTLLLVVYRPLFPLVDEFYKVIFADGGIRTVDLWCWKRPLYYLRPCHLSSVAVFKEWPFLTSVPKR